MKKMSVLLTALSLIGGLSQPLGVSQYDYIEYNNVVTPIFITSQIETSNFDLRLDPNNKQLKITCNSDLVSYWHEQYGMDGRPRQTFRDKLPSSTITIDNTEIQDLKYISGIECNYTITNFGYGALYNDNGTIINNKLELFYDIYISYDFYYTKDINNTIVISSQKIQCWKLTEVYLQAPYYITQNSQKGRDIISTRNELSQTSFDLTEIIKAWIQQEEQTYNTGLEDGKTIGYAEGFDDGQQSASSWQSFLNGIFNVIDNCLSFEILPNVKLWYIVGVPLVLSVIKFIMGWFR